MAVQGIGELTGTDEGFNHQIVDTFSTVAESDRSWTEKVWASLASRDGSIQVDLGLSQYHNRKVMDAFAGISRGREQWTVRASRAVDGRLDTSVGPILYEIVEPLNVTRFVLQDNDSCDIAFDLTFTGVMQPFFEDRNSYRDLAGRVSANVIRYHQAGEVHGWFRIGADRHAVDRDGWFGFRDHSWGVRGEGAVGAPPADVAPNPIEVLSGDSDLPCLMHWTPWCLRRPDGTRYAIHFLIMEVAGFRVIDSAYVNSPDGQQQRVRHVTPDLSYHPQTRFLQGGQVHLELATGKTLTVDVSALDDTGFFLRPGGYGDWRGHRHGVWRGALDVDGEYIPDCHSPDMLPTLGQFRDKPVRLREGDAEGYGIYETIVTGVWPDLGLTAESNYGGY
jgi:hypothetical protein